MKISKKKKFLRKTQKNFMKKKYFNFRINLSLGKTV